MSLPELEVYYCERRKQLFKEGKKLKNIKLRERAYPLFAGLLKIDRILRKQTVTVIGNHKKHKGQVIYACTHIGENDLERSGDAGGSSEIHVYYTRIFQGCLSILTDVLCSKPVTRMTGKLPISVRLNC
jgi:hypothetical protein